MSNSLLIYCFFLLIFILLYVFPFGLFFCYFPQKFFLKKKGGGGGGGGKRGGGGGGGGEGEGRGERRVCGGSCL